MKKLALVVLVLVGLGSAGCSTKGYIRAEGIAEIVSSIVFRHDGYVSSDPSYFADVTTKAQRESDLRESALLRKIVDEARKP